MSPRSLSPWRAFWRRFVVALIVVTILASGSVATALIYANNKVDDIANAEIEEDTLTPVEKGEPANFLIIGSDTRSFVSDAQDEIDFGDPEVQTGQRSDTILIAHIDPDTETGMLVSFPRDLWVDIPGLGESRINAAYNGEQGPTRLINTIEQNFDIPINHYLEVDFAGFRGIVDAIGSVPIWFPAPARDEYTTLHIPLPGCYDLTGKQALDYVRSRHYEYFDSEQQEWRDDPYSDLSRIRRQQYFIRSLAAVAIDQAARHPARAFAIVNESVKHLKKDADLSYNDITALVNTFRQADPELVEMLTVPAERAFIDGNDVLQLDEAAAAPIFEQLRTFGADVPSEPPADLDPGDVSVRVLNGSGITGQARTTLDVLAEAGFAPLEPPADADRSDYSTTEVRFVSGSEGAAALVASYLGTGQAVEISESEAQGADVVVVLGADFESVIDPVATTPTTAAPTTTPAPTVATTTTTIPPNPGTTPGITAPSRPEGGHPLVGC